MLNRTTRPKLKRRSSRR